MKKQWVMGALMLAAAMMPLASVQAQGMGVAAVVNDDMISTLDIEQRMAFVMATTGLQDSPEVRKKLSQQIIRALVDERLQNQEAKREGIMVTPEDIAGAYARVDSQRQLPPGSFKSFLERNQIPTDTVEEQMRAQIGWSKLVFTKMRAKVRVSEEEVKLAREQLAQGQNVTEYQISSIVLAVNDPSEDASVRELADDLSKEITNGASFEALARQFSAGGADMVEQNQYRWVQLHQLEPALAKRFAKLIKGQVTEPIRTLSGYHLIKLHDTRKSNTSTTLDSEVLLKQITMKLKPEAEKKEADTLIDIAREVGKYPGSCQDDKVAGVGDLGELEFDVKFERAAFRNIQPQMQSILANLRVGDVSEPFATPEGIHMVMLCERIELPQELPPVEKVKERLYQEKLELEAAKRLRELRREAFVEVRN